MIAYLVAYSSLLVLISNLFVSNLAGEYFLLVRPPFNMVPDGAFRLPSIFLAVQVAPPFTYTLRLEHHLFFFFFFLVFFLFFILFLFIARWAVAAAKSAYVPC